ncbi:type IV pilus biogenesis protein PilP [Ralstonia solanacearum]|nr:type IV pilus biogenesis protein PilP [Ralstonia solanacearum]MBB6596969.1 type IV pilus biogenesis protein PilP [Ralstonia solanacearum]
MAQGASAPRMAQAMQAAQSIRDPHPGVPTAPASRAAQADPVPVPAQPAAPVAQSHAAATVSNPATVTAGIEADELGLLQRQAAVLKVKADIAKYQADIKSSEARAQQAATGATLGATGEPAVPLNLVVPGNLPKAPVTRPAATHGKPRLIHIGGADGAYSAIIEVNGITIFDAVAGTQLDDGWQVIGVEANQVKVKRGKQVLPLKV